MSEVYAVVGYTRTIVSYSHCSSSLWMHTQSWTTLLQLYCTKILHAIRHKQYIYTVHQWLLKCSTIAELNGGFMNFIAILVYNLTTKSVHIFDTFSMSELQIHSAEKQQLHSSVSLDSWHLHSSVSLDSWQLLSHTSS